MLHVLLPNLCLCAQDPVLRVWLLRGDRVAAVEAGYLAAVAAHFGCSSAILPVAALLRDAGHGDAGDDAWMCADPAFVQPDMTGARMLCCGNMDLQNDEAEALVHFLQPLFGDHGFLLEPSQPACWHLRLADNAQWPDLVVPEHVLGDDLLAHLPRGRNAGLWRSLFNEAQVMLHQHPVNGERRAQGRMPVNCLWFWGAGTLPLSVKSDLDGVFSDDPLTRTLAQRAGIACDALAAFDIDARSGRLLLDLQSGWNPALHASWLTRALHRHGSMQLEWASGERLDVRAWHRWRVWRRL